MASEGTRQINFRLGPLAGPVGRRTGGDGMSPGQVIRRDIARYYTLMDLALARARAEMQLTEREALLVTWALQSSLVADTSGPGDARWQLAWADVLESVEHEHAHEHAGMSVEQAEDVASRLRKLGLAETLAVCEAVERYWAIRADRIAQGASERDVMAEVGLLAAHTGR